MTRSLANTPDHVADGRSTSARIGRGPVALRRMDESAAGLETTPRLPTPPDATPAPPDGPKSRSGASRDALPPFWVLRRHDQWGVALLVAIAVAMMLVWAWRHWWSGTQLVAFEDVPRQEAPLRVDVNTATWPELTQLPQIGETYARRIVEYRETHGPFRRAEELVAIEGIGQRRYERIAPCLLPIDAPPGEEVAVASPKGGAGDAPAVDEVANSTPLDTGDGLVDLNHASAALLDTLPGVGPVLARRIIDSREREGPFRAVDDIERVSGIGPKTLEKIRPLATVRTDN